MDCYLTSHEIVGGFDKGLLGMHSRLCKKGGATRGSCVHLKVGLRDMI